MKSRLIAAARTDTSERLLLHYYGILVQGGQKVDLREILPDFKPMIIEEEFGLVQSKRRNLKKVVSASVKAKKRHQGKLAQAFIDFGLVPATGFEPAHP